MASRHQGKATRILFRKTEHIEDADGYRIRVWGDPNEDWVKPTDVRAWLRGKRVIEADELRSGLEYVRESYISMMIRDGYLRPDLASGFYWITEKAAERFGLERVLGKAFPK